MHLSLLPTLAGAPAPFLSATTWRLFAAIRRMNWRRSSQLQVMFVADCCCCR